MSAVIEVEIRHAVPGMKVAGEVLNAERISLVTPGTVLNKTIIEKLHNWEIKKILIEQEVEVISPVLAAQHEKFVQSYAQTANLMDDLWKKLKHSEKVPLDNLKETSDEMTSQVIKAGNMVDQLYPLPDKDDLMNYHATNVGVVSALIALWLGYPHEMINAISFAGLMHDIGKSQLPIVLLAASSRTPEQEAEYKLHCLYGEILLKNSGMAESISQAVFQHHELIDGNGYPQQLKGDEIHPYAKIIAVANTFDKAMINRFKSEKMVSPYQGVEFIRNQIHLFDPKIVLTFCENMTNYLSGNIVELTNGENARVVCVNKERPSQSIVKLNLSGAVINLEEAGASIKRVIPKK